MVLIEVSSEGQELIGHEDAKRHLGVYGGEHDQALKQKISQARESCEACTQRTLRERVTRRLVTGCWKEAFGYLPWPPVIEVSSVSYFATGASVATVLPASSYRLVPSGASVALLEWVDGADRPSLDARSDAVTVEFVTGYGDRDSIPYAAKAAVELMLQVLWGRDHPKSIELAQRSADALLAQLTVGHYR